MSLGNVLKVVSVLFVARTQSKSTTNGSNYHTSTVKLHGGVPSQLSGITRPTFPLLMLRKYGNVPLHQIHMFTKFDGRGAYHF